MPRPYVAKAPLFEQLTKKSEFSKEPVEAPVLLDEEDLKASVQRELSEILNTRSSMSNATIDDLVREAGSERLVAGTEGMMGLPELRDAFAEGSVGAGDFAGVCACVIRLYEPRLKNPVVHIVEFDSQTQRLHIVIEGELVFGARRGNVSFSVTIPNQKTIKNKTISC